MKIKKVVSGLLALSIAVGSMYVVSAMIQSFTNGTIRKALSPPAAKGSALQSLGRVTTAGISIFWTSPPPRWIRWRNMKFIPNSIA